MGVSILAKETKCDLVSIAKGILMGWNGFA